MSAPTNSPLVEFREVSFSHTGASAAVISHLTFSVQQGETLVLLGESGCGKTTTLKLINRLLLPTSGQVMVENRSTTEWDPIRLRRRTGYVIQEGGLFPHFTVERNVGLVPALERWDDTRIKKRDNELLSLVVAAEPPLLLLDEPFGALDPLSRASLQRQFAELTRRLNKTAVFVTHDVREALLLGSRIGLMHEGHLLLLETPENFLKSKNERALAYIETLALGPTSLAPAEGGA